MIRRLALAAALALVVPGTPGAEDLATIDGASAQAWADDMFGKAFEQKRFSGAVISVVKDGTVIFSKGYGYADYPRQTPIDPANSLMRVCSNTKVFVATALMQLVDRGLIASLDDPANRYLKRIQLPAFNGTDVLVRHLTRHRAGFEDSYFNAGTKRRVATPVDAATARRLVPEIVREPGSLSVYSNAALAVQGLMIEDVTGMKLGDYLAENIFRPLGMSRTLLNDGPPPPAGHAQPYILYADGTAKAAEVVAKHPVYAPSGGIYSTAEDMARFVIAHLDAGWTATNPILSPEGFARMHRPAVRNHLALPGLGVQFVVEDINGERVVSHGCGLPGFTSYLAFMPEHGVGMFVSLAAKRETVSGFEKLLRGYFPVPEDKAAVPANSAARFFYGFLREFVGFGEPEVEASFTVDPGRYAGVYRGERRGFTNMLAGLDLLFPDAATLTVAGAEDGALAINERAPFVATDAHVFRRGSHPTNLYVFDSFEDGKAQRVLRSYAQVWTRVGFWDNPRTMNALLGILAIVSLTGFLAPVAAGRRPAVAPWEAWLPAALMVSLLAVWALANMGFADDKNIEHYVNEGGVTRLVFIVILCNLIALLAIAMGVAAARSWRRPWKDAATLVLARRAHYGLLALAALCYIPILFSYKLIGWTVP